MAIAPRMRKALLLCVSRSWLLLFPTLLIMCSKNEFEWVRKDFVHHTFGPNFQEAGRSQHDIRRHTGEYSGRLDEVSEDGFDQSSWRFLNSKPWSSRADALNPERTPPKFKTERRLSNIFYRLHDSSNHEKTTKSAKSTGKTKTPSSKKSSGPTKKAKSLSDTEPKKTKGKDTSSDNNSTSKIGKGKKESKKSQSTRNSPVSAPSRSDRSPVKAPVFIWRPIDREPSRPRSPAPVGVPMQAPDRVPTSTLAPTPTMTTEPGSPPPVTENDSSSSSPTMLTEIPTMNSSLGSSDFPTSQMIAQLSPRPSSSNQPSALSSFESTMGSSDEASDVPTFFFSDPPSLLQSFSPTRVGNSERLDENRRNGQKKFAFRSENLDKKWA